MDKATPTGPILGQVLGEVELMHITFNLFLPRSRRSSSTSLALHYDVFDPSNWASCVFLCTCLNHLNLFSHIFAERGATPNFSLNSWFLFLSIIYYHTSTSVYAFMLLPFSVRKPSLRANILSHKTTLA